MNYKSIILKSACMFMGITASVNEAHAVDVNMQITRDSLQHITGFGAAAIGTLMCPLQDVQPIKLAYGEDSPIGFNIMRIEVVPNPTGNNPADNQWYDSPYDWHGFVNVVKEGRKRGSIIYACPWSPMPSLKTNGESSGGNYPQDKEDAKTPVRATLNESGYKNFFRWLNNFTKYMKSQNAPVDIISLQNEPDWWVNYSGCLYEPQDLAKLVKQSASTFDPYTSAADPSKPIKLMSGEPLGYRSDYADSILSDPESRKYIDYLGGHIYGHPPYQWSDGRDGEMKKSADIAAKYGVKEIWMTEHSYDPWTPNTMPTWEEQIGFAKEVNEVILAGGTAYVYWYLTQFWGFIGDGENGIKGNDVDGYNTKNVILPRGYVASHFAKHLAGSQRLKNITKLGASVLKEMAGIQRNVFSKGDSLIVIAINGSAADVNLNITTPEAIDNGKIITSTSNQSLCKESVLDIETGSKAFSTPIKAKSVNTIILKRSSSTGITEKSEDQPAASKQKTMKGIYTLSGQKLNCDEDELPSGIYVINGQKVTK